MRSLVEIAVPLLAHGLSFLQDGRYQESGTKLAAVASGAPMSPRMVPVLPAVRGATTQSLPSTRCWAILLPSYSPCHGEVGSDVGSSLVRSLGQLPSISSIDSYNPLTSIRR